MGVLTTQGFACLWNGPTSVLRDGVSWEHQERNTPRVETPLVPKPFTGEGQNSLTQGWNKPKPYI